MEGNMRQKLTGTLGLAVLLIAVSVGRGRAQNPPSYDDAQKLISLMSQEVQRLNSAAEQFRSSKNGDNDKLLERNFEADKENLKLQLKKLGNWAKHAKLTKA